MQLLNERCKRESFPRRASDLYKTRKHGFTLIEIMVVVIVLAILAASIIPQFVGTKQEARISKVKTDIALLEGALERFFLNMDRYPTNSEGLRVLVETPQDGENKWRGPYVKTVRPDPWGNEYAYRFPGLHDPRTFDIYSTGADGKDGGEDVNADISNWDN